jgi:hypothetical protein
MAIKNTNMLATMQHGLNEQRCSSFSYLFL